MVFVNPEFDCIELVGQRKVLFCLWCSLLYVSSDKEGILNFVNSSEHSASSVYLKLVFIKVVVLVVYKY